MQNSKTFLLVLLGILAAFGPFVTDMYLPGLPSMTVYFDTTASMVQLGITTAMLGLGFGQIIVGPLSDKYGRKLPLLLSLWLFIFSTNSSPHRSQYRRQSVYRRNHSKSLRQFFTTITIGSHRTGNHNTTGPCNSLEKTKKDKSSDTPRANTSDGRKNKKQLVGYFCFSTVFRSSVAFTLLAPERAFTS